METENQLPVDLSRLFYNEFNAQLQQAGIVAKSCVVPADGERQAYVEQDLFILPDFLDSLGDKYALWEKDQLDAAIIGKLTARLIGADYDVGEKINPFVEHLYQQYRADSSRPENERAVLRKPTLEEVKALLDKAIENIHAPGQAADAAKNGFTTRLIDTRGQFAALG